MGSGLLVTRSAGRAKFGDEIAQQLFGQSKALGVAAIIIGALGLSGFVGYPFPPLPLLAVAGVCGFLWYSKRQGGAVAESKAKADKQAKKQAQDAAKPAADEKVESFLRIDPMSLEMGYEVLPLVDPQQTGQGGGLLGRVKIIRQQLASEMGIIVPPIRIRDNMNLKPNEYVFNIQGAPVANGTAETTKYLAMDPGMATEKIDGIATVEPAFGLPAVWINPSNREYAERVGYTVVDAETVVATHLTEVIKERAGELLTREEVRKLLDATKEYAPAAVQEAEAAASLGDIQKILQNLLRERVSIRNLPSILETIGDLGKRVKDTEILTELVRATLGRWLCNEYSQNGRLHVITFDPRLEEAIAGRIERTDGGSFLALRPPASQKLLDAIRAEVHRQLQAGHEAVLLVSPQIRLQMKRLTRSAPAGSALPRLTVLSYNEIHSDFAVESVGMVSVEL
jgi:flagellar biosynthesis protein FlhA